MKYVPEWFPGAKFQKFARYYRGIQAAFRDRPFKAVQDAMVRATLVLDAGFYGALRRVLEIINRQWFRSY